MSRENPWRLGIVLASHDDPGRRRPTTMMVIDAERTAQDGARPAGPTARRRIGDPVGG